MLRGYRHFVFALVGWLALANAPSPRTQPEQPKTEANKTEAAKSVSAPSAQPVEPTQPAELYRPCEGGEKDRNSDLCAQWKAAEAAREAADWTYWGLWLGIIGTVGLFGTLFYTREAVKAAQEATKDADSAIAIAGRNADAAAKQAAIAEDTAKRELQAYIISKDHQVNHFFAGGRCRFIAKLHNFGQTPAHDVRCVTLIRATTEDVEKYRFFFRARLMIGAVSRAIIGPGDFHVHINEMEGPLAHQPWMMIIRGEIKVIFAGVVSYRDVFGKRHLTTFKYALDPGILNIKDTVYDLVACGNGNKAN